jgi:DNA modification methylase
MRTVVDRDFVLHVGEALDVLRELRDGSVDCCVTSPPYWGLRDYGTGSWEGGDPFCDHDAEVRRLAERHVGTTSFSATSEAQISAAMAIHGRDGCPTCGAERVDKQLGLEPAPELYVERLVGILAEVRRVLAPHGTLWLNLGDSYASSTWGSGSNSAKQLTNKGSRFDDPRRRNGYRDGRTNRNERLTAGGATFKPLSEAAEAARNRDGVPAVPGIRGKNLVGIPWRVAFALQAAGWWLRADVIWAKPNPMPESMTDRPTRSHEHVFMLAKSARYYFDQEAVREPLAGPLHAPGNLPRATGGLGQDFEDGERADDVWGSPAGRNMRDVWTIATAPYADAHFATYPPELVRRALLAGCPELVCRECGEPRRRIVERTPATPSIVPSEASEASGRPRRAGFYDAEATTVGWTDCGHGAFRRGVVLDPFLGSGTTALVAREQGRNCVGVELNPAYGVMIARRLQQLSLFAEAPHASLEPALAPHSPQREPVELTEASA